MMAPVQIKAEDGMEGGWQGGVGLQPGMGPRVSWRGQTEGSVPRLFLLVPLLCQSPVKV